MILPKLDGVIINLSYEAKYLGVILDSKLTWSKNAQLRVQKSQNALYACRSSIGKTWGLSPKIVKWLYSSVIRPILMHGCVVWWQSLKKDYICKMFNKVQRQICISISGAIKTTSYFALSTILGLPFTDEFITYTASNSALRLRNLDAWTDKSYGHASLLTKSRLSKSLSFDSRIPLINFEK